MKKIIKIITYTIKMVKLMLMPEQKLKMMIWLRMLMLDEDYDHKLNATHLSDSLPDVWVNHYFFEDF